MKKLLVMLLVLGTSSLASATVVKATRNCNVALSSSDTRNVKEIKRILEAHQFKVTIDQVEHEHFPLQEEFLLTADVLGESHDFIAKFNLIQMKVVDQGGEFINSQSTNAFSDKQARKKLNKLLEVGLPVCDGF